MIARGPEWAAWVDELPKVTQRLLAEWTLRPDGPASHGFCSLVLPVRTQDGDSAVLKISFPDAESEHEHLALQRWGGRWRGPGCGSQAGMWGPCSDDVRGETGFGVAFCGGVRCCCGCSFGGGDVFVHRCGGFDPSVGSRPRGDAGGTRTGARRDTPGPKSLTRDHGNHADGGVHRAGGSDSQPESVAVHRNPWCS